MDQQRLLLLLNYQLREGCVCALQETCNRALAVRTNDHIALFWKSVGLLLESRTAEVSTLWCLQVHSLEDADPVHLLLLRHSGNCSHCYSRLK